MILRSASTLAVSALLLLPACGGEPPGDGTALVATTTIWADITSHVACGEAVTAAIPAGADPHTFEPSLRDRELVERADLVVANGGDLEEALLDVLRTTSATVVEMSTRIDLISHDHDDDGELDDHGHVHGEGNPHIWHDPTRVAGALDLIASALTATDRDADAIDGCTEAYRSELGAVDAEITRLLAPITPEARVLVTNHDSLAYFADRYGFEVLGTVLPANTTMAETNPAELERLADLIVERGVTAIFVDESAPSADAEALARRVGADIVPLKTGSLDADGPAATYVGMLRSNATAIAEALTP